MIFFTSDLHLGHENCIRLCNRPFSSIEEMDETLIENWNHKVTGKDTVYILGDLIYRSQKPPEEYLRRLRGKKHLILGNHDRGWIRSCQTEQFFESVNNLLYVADGKRQYSRGIHLPEPAPSGRSYPFRSCGRDQRTFEPIWRTGAISPSVV